MQTDLWHANLRSVAVCVPTLNFVGWHGEHYVVARGDERVEVREEGRADERGVGDDAKVAAEVREAPDRGEDPGSVWVRCEVGRDAGIDEDGEGEGDSQHCERCAVRDPGPNTVRAR